MNPKLDKISEVIIWGWVGGIRPRVINFASGTTSSHEVRRAEYGLGAYIF